MGKYSTFLLLLLGSSFLIVQNEARPSPEEDADDDWASFNESEEDVVAPRAIDNNSHDDHQDHAILSPQQESGKSGFSGGNLANFNESCSTKACNTNNALYCNNNFNPSRCDCNLGYTYIKSQERCYPIWRKDGPNCDFDDQCHASSTGLLSHCDRVLGSCDCIKGMGKWDVVKHRSSGSCVYKKNFGDLCSSDEECEVTMKINSYCAPADPNAPPVWQNSSRICQCKSGYIWDNLHSECLRIATTGVTSECKSNLQCSSSSMGSLSDCDMETKKCKCWDSRNPGDDNVVFYGKTGICYEFKDFNHPCTHHDECKASISSQAECLPKPEEGVAGTQQLICQCPQGKTCPRDAGDGGAFAVGGSIVNTLVIALCVSYTFFKN